MALFDVIKGSFWSDGTYDRQPPLTDDAIRQAEAILGVKLPAALLDLLRIQNGGQVANEWSAYPTNEPTSWADDHVPFDSLMGIGDAEAATSLLDTPYLAQEWGLPVSVVLLAGDGHFWIALDYRASGPQCEPSVTWFDTDLRTELRLALDFRSFVEGLTQPDSGSTS